MASPSRKTYDERKSSERRCVPWPIAAKSLLPTAGVMLFPYTNIVLPVDVGVPPPTSARSRSQVPTKCTGWVGHILAKPSIPAMRSTRVAKPCAVPPNFWDNPGMRPNHRECRMHIFGVLPFYPHFSKNWFGWRICWRWLCDQFCLSKHAPSLLNSIQVLCCHCRELLLPPYPSMRRMWTTPFLCRHFPGLRLALLLWSPRTSLHPVPSIWAGSVDSCASLLPDISRLKMHGPSGNPSHYT